MTGLLNDMLIQTGTSPASYTVRGQAYFADASIGARCVSCEFFPENKVSGHCAKATQLAQRQMVKIPATAYACKYFERRR